MAADKRFAEMKQTFGFALRVVSFITIPATVGLILLRVPITRVLFEHGAFTANSTALTADLDSPFIPAAARAGPARLALRCYWRLVRTLLPK